MSFMADSTQPALGAVDNTEIVAVDYPHEAWSQELPTVEYRHRSGYVLPVLVALIAVTALALVFAVVLWGDPVNRKPLPPQPIAAPPTVKTWTPDRSKDDQFIQALKDAGFTGFTPTNRSTDIAIAHWACTYLSQGHSTADVVKHWDEMPLPGEAPFTDHDDNVMWANLVTANECPQF